MSSVRRPTDADLGAIAGRLRILTRAQLTGAGLTRQAVAVRVEQGRLQHLWRHVYLVGPAPPHPFSLAAGGVAACAGPAAVSHRWALYVLGLVPAPPPPVDVTVTSGSRRGRKGQVRVHLSRTIERRDLTVRQGVPVTSAARTMLDVAPATTPHELERLLSEAQVAQLLTERELTDVLRRAGRHKGVAKLRTLTGDAPGVTLSEAERILRRLLREAGIARPLTNHPIGPYRADFCWPDRELIVEFDSFSAHGHRRAFHHDRRRNAELAAGGWSVLPITWTQLRDEPLAVVARISAALAVRARTPDTTIPAA